MYPNVIGDGVLKCLMDYCKLYVHNRWMEITNSVRLWKKCLWPTILPIPNPYLKEKFF
jgi:hypothetical protein